MVPPRPWRIICRKQARLVRKAPSRCTARTFRQSASDRSTSGAMCWMPALLTRMSTPPSRAATSSTPASTCASSATFIATAVAMPPPSVISLTTSWAPPRLRSATATLAPSRAKRSAICLPIPLADPVTMASFPSRRDMASLLNVHDRAYSGTVGGMISLAAVALTTSATETPGARSRSTSPSAVGSITAISVTTRLTGRTEVSGIVHSLPGADEREIGAERLSQQPGFAIDVDGEFVSLDDRPQAGPGQHASQAGAARPDPLGERPLGHQFDLEVPGDHLPLCLWVGSDMRGNQALHHPGLDQLADANTGICGIVGNDHQPLAPGGDEPLDRAMR